jgi:ribosomal protein S18
MNDIAILGAFNTQNLGDAIQSLAILRSVGKMDFFVEREKISDIHPPCKCVMNAWWKHNTKDFPPHKNIVPLWIGVHISKEELIKDHLEYWKKNEPIGCRDTYTEELFRKYKVESYFSACLSITLPKPPECELRSEVNLLIDVPKVFGIKNGIRLDTFSSFTGDCVQKINKVYRNIYLYSKARSVVTSRLHVALPCYAIGTPVLYINDRDKKRFTGYETMINNCGYEDKDTIKRFLDNPKNIYPEEYFDLKKKLQERVRKFIDEN